MVSVTRNDDDDFEGTGFTREDDGSVTVRDTGTGLARDGDARAEVPSQLAEALALHEGGGEPITDNDLEELGLDPDRLENHKLPDLMQQTVQRTLSGREVTKILTKYGYIPKSCHGSHVRLRYKYPETGGVRNIGVPQHDELKIGILRSIVDQCSVKNFHSWCEWIKQVLQPSSMWASVRWTPDYRGD